MQPATRMAHPTPLDIMIDHALQQNRSYLQSAHTRIRDDVDNLSKRTAWLAMAHGRQKLRGLEQVQSREEILAEVRQIGRLFYTTTERIQADLKGVEQSSKNLEIVLRQLITSNLCVSLPSPPVSTMSSTESVAR
ncbi:unnamed protein product [Tilletia controversa]|uniref:Uncharacterized protein n=1 Tax=Tilletia controversa TaxID=13291 RepID=A0A8X7SY58_9BASI|nr:hypothetical protein A4X06_0g2863 [Tilletia controversa]CAD6917596.1 unnamed protein product [Tilletia controversa]CAD6934455.1 unnamed protein product [Tilletia controversa]CAD6975716.1 unnamed protein product [Tilletia controversa]